jgi:hypothetical protein
MGPLVARPLREYLAPLASAAGGACDPSWLLVSAVTAATEGRFRQAGQRGGHGQDVASEVNDG